jgi:hypothetical protein
MLDEYITTMLWTDCPQDDPDRQPGEFTDSACHHKWLKRMTKASREIMARDLGLFLSAAGRLIESDPLRAARDFWLTRNGNGCGFWDGDWDHVPATLPQFENAGEQLTALAHAFGNVYVDFDGWVRVSDPLWDDREDSMALSLIEAGMELMAAKSKLQTTTQ